MFEVLDPTGATEITQLHAERLGSLDQKRIAFLSDDMWQAHRILPLIREHISTHYPNVSLVAETDLPMGNTAIDTDATADAIVAQGIDAVVVGNAS
ncbi:MAG: hypothetical protein K0U93_05445 [Gammaproteobacteria bacterium]|nr:hypothetical protein [Gammaproteobacteria bacterium]